MCYKSLISSIALLAFLSCSPDQEVLQEEVPYEILDIDINDFSEKDRQKIENIKNGLYNKTEANSYTNLKNPQSTMTGTFSVYGVVYDKSTNIVMSGAHVLALENKQVSHGVQTYAHHQPHIG